jgi:hypothetical protein
MVATFQDKVTKSPAATEDGRKDMASRMANGQKAMVSDLQNKCEKDHEADRSVIASQALTSDTKFQRSDNWPPPWSNKASALTRSRGYLR